MSTTHDDDDDAPAHPKKAGEGWVVTFADMMALLMSFFVLLLSFSEQDSAKFKEVGGSLEQAFGVQREVIAYQMPKGTSIVAKEFSPGKPKPTAINEIRQKTIDDMAQTLEYDEKENPVKKKKEEMTDIGSGESEKRKKSSLEISDKIAQMLATEILEGKIEIEKKHQRIVIRILDQGTFASGDDSIHPSYEPILTKIADLLSGIPGQITVAGHTDDRAIATRRFRSNWELSAARALTVAHELYERGVDKSRLVVSGYADTAPMVPNDTDEHRSKNRRVEIVINQKDRPERGVIPDAVPTAPAFTPNQPKEIKVSAPKG